MLGPGKSPVCDLVALARAGDHRAFRAIFDRYALVVRRFCLDLLKSHSAADDATQETFVRAHARLASLRDPDKLGGWLLGIARFVVLERLRMRKQENLHDSIHEASADEDGRLTSREPSPAKVLLKAEADRLLTEALSHLSSDRQQALLLRIDHRLDYEEIGEIMEWPLSKVKNEIHRARLQLRQRLADFAEGELQ